MQAIDPGTSVSFAGTIDLVTTSGIGGGVLAQDFNISGNISGNGGLIKYGTNRVNLNDTGTFTGDTELVAGTLGIYGLSLQDSTLDLSNASDTGVLGFGGAFTLGGITGIRNFDGGGYAISIGNDNQNTTYSGMFSGLSLNKIGNGTLTLTATNTFTGNVAINGGAISVSALAANGVASNLRAGAEPQLQRRHAPVYRRAEHGLQPLDFPWRAAAALSSRTEAATCSPTALFPAVECSLRTAAVSWFLMRATRIPAKPTSTWAP